MQAPVLVLNTETRRESGRSAQMSNIAAAVSVSEVVRTTLGPKAMLKMILDAMGGIVLTNDGNAILREIDVSHPAAKSMIELARAQDEEVGDGTTSVIILSGEMLRHAAPILQDDMHPTVITRAYNLALDHCLEICKKLAVHVDGREKIFNLTRHAVSQTLSMPRDQLTEMALRAVECVTIRKEGRIEVDTKRYAKTEKIPGGSFEECRVVDGVMFNKDVTHQKMRRRIENPRIVLLDCGMEYKKAESSVDVEITDEAHWERLLQLEEEHVKKLCDYVIALKPDVVITEKGFSDLAQHYMIKAGITAFRRVRKTDNNRIARACGATIVHRCDELQESDVGTNAGLFEVRKIGDDYFTFIEQCKEPKACSILLRGASKDILMDIERNLFDAIQVARNLTMEPMVLPGGGATEMACAAALYQYAKTFPGEESLPIQAVANALEVIPRTLVKNCGANVVRTITELRARHSESSGSDYTPQYWGIDGANEGQIKNMKDMAILEPFCVKVQTLKTAIESSCMLLRIDDIVSGVQAKGSQYSQALASGQLDG